MFAEIVATNALEKIDSVPELKKAVAESKVKELSQKLSELAGFSLAINKHPSGFAVQVKTDEEVQIRAFLGQYFALEKKPSSPLDAGASGVNKEELIAMLQLPLTKSLPSDPKGAKKIVQDELPADFKPAVTYVGILTSAHKLKVHCRISQASMDADLKPHMQRLGAVEVLTAEQARDQKRIDSQTKATKKAAKATVGNLSDTLKAVSLLSQIHGTGGSGKKRRRYARRGTKIIKVSQTAAASDLRELQDAGSSESSGEDTEVEEAA